MKEETYNKCKVLKEEIKINTRYIDALEELLRCKHIKIKVTANKFRPLISLESDITAGDEFIRMLLKKEIELKKQQLKEIQEAFDKL